MDYSRCDSLVLIDKNPVDLHYKVNLLHQHDVGTGSTSKDAEELDSISCSNEGQWMHRQ